ncbi:MAG: hypothetical protein WBL23_04110, partial [Salinisphaera sp.]|uniref:hypothetical protein n=1 Tax=Salinisphaera sp. TaxID=1914330 RepID=UPI003C7BAD7B
PPSNVGVINSRAVGCQPVHRRLWLADGRAVHYDRLSLNMGTRRLPFWAMRPCVGQPRTWSGHSVMQLIGLRATLVADERSSVVIVGGSRQALEIAGGLAAPAGSSGLDGITLLWPNRGGDDRKTRAALRRLAWWGVDVVATGGAAALGEGCLHCIDGRRFPADHVICAGPPEPDPVALAMTLPAYGPGLRVERRLTSPQASSIQVSGAAASLDGRHVLAGWDGERQACVMLAGLRADAGPHALQRYAPSRRGMPVDLGAQAGVVSGMRWFGWRARRQCRLAQREWLADPDR